MTDSARIDADNTQDEDAEVPHLDGWNASRLLAQGTHAEAWVVESLSPGREPCVLKIPRTSDDVATLRRETRFAGALSHPHIVAFQGTVETSRGEGTLWELCPAGDALSLVHVLGPLRVAQAVTVLVPLAQALDHAHEGGVVHGDVSPGNVVFDTSGRPKLCDIGEARTVTSPDRWTGTEGFSAPELDLDERRDSLQPAADVYSLAALGWFLLTGRIPGDESRRPALNVLLPGVGNEVTELLETCLSTSPEHRPSLAEFSVACYAWAVPEPLELHALVDERTALFLPTRHERGAQPVVRPSRRRVGARRRGAERGRPKRVSSRRQPYGQVRRRLRGAHVRMASGVGAAVLGASLILADLWMPADREENLDTRRDATVTTMAPDPEWESIVNQWSHDRATALTDRDAEAVSSYAVDSGHVARDDRALIRSLRDQNIVYENLSMTAQVKEVHSDDSVAHVFVEWTMSSYTALPEDGTEDLEEHAPGNTDQVRIESRLVDDEWRIESVTPHSTAGTAAHAGGSLGSADTAG